MVDFSNYGALQTMFWVMENITEGTGTAGTPVQLPAELYVKLHLGDPGPDGLLLPAVNTLRKVVPLTQPAVNISTDGRAQIVTDSEIIWTSVPATETYSHVSFWDDLTAGNCWYKGAMVAPVAVTTGGNFVFPSAQTFDHV